MKTKIDKWAAAALLAALMTAGSLQAQTPRLIHVFPPGGKAGTTVEVIVTAQDLVDPDGLHLSFPGAKFESLGMAEAPAKEIKGKKGKGMAKSGPISRWKFRIALPANVPLGIHDLRVVGRGGISNPRAFVVGDLPEVLEKEKNDDVDEAQQVPLGTIVDGVVAAPTDVDYFRFEGKKGQRVVVSCLTSSIDSKLPAHLQLHGADGKLLGTNKGYFQDDAVVDAVLPADGVCTVRLCSFAYTQGGNDHFYRLTIAAAPWIDAVFPPVVGPGKNRLTIYGRNLPGGKIDPGTGSGNKTLERAEIDVAGETSAGLLDYRGFVPPRAAFLDGQEFSVRSPAGSSNPVLLLPARGPVVVDGPDDDRAENAVKVPLPCTIAGRIDKKRDEDWFAFTAKKGQKIDVEVLSDRLGAPHDLYVQIRDGKNKVLLERDDDPDSLTNSFYASTTDPPVFRFTAPADGNYFLVVRSRDAMVGYGIRYGYVVHLGQAEPDFRLVAIPADPLYPEAGVLHQGGHEAWQIFVRRLGGFQGAIVLSAEGLPAGIELPPQTLAAGQDRALFVLGAAAGAKPWQGPIRLIGTAEVRGKKVVRPVRSGTITWGSPNGAANIPLIARLDRELVLAVRGEPPYLLKPDTQRLVLKQGDKATVKVSGTFGKAFKGTVQVVPLGLPTGLAAKPATLAPGQKGVPLTLDCKVNTPPGRYTLVLRGQTQLKPPVKAGGPPNLTQAAPPIDLLVLPKQLAKLKLSGKSAKALRGKSVELTLDVNREFDYDGPFRLSLEKAPKGVVLKTKEIPPEAEEVPIVLQLDQNVPAGTLNAVLRATALFHGTPIEHETKLTLVVAK